MDPLGNKSRVTAFIYRSNRLISLFFLKIVFTILVIVALAGFGGYFFLRTPATPSAPSAENAPANSAREQETPQPQDQSASSPTEETASVITYSDNGYAPKTITIKTGQSVTFKNQSSQSMWTASGVHPTHRVYPTTGGCIGSTFDACRGVQPGDSWSFTFDIPGTWKYHDHLNPDNTGTVIVE